MTPATRFLSILAVLFLCTGSYDAVASLKISGHVTHPAGDTVSVMYNDNRLAWYPEEHRAVLDAKGNFSMDIPFPGGTFILTEFRHGDHVAEFFPVDGDSLHITVDVAHFDSSIRYSGRGAATQNFVARHTIERGRFNNYTIRLRNHIAANPDDYLKAINQELAVEKAFTSEHGKGVPASFIRLWNAGYMFYNYFFIEQYPQMHEMQRVRRYTDTIPQELYTVVEALPDSLNDDYIQLPSYLLYLSGLYETRLRAAGYGVPVSDSGNARRLLDSVNTLAFRRMPPRSGEYFIAQSLYARARVQQLERTRSVFASFSTRWPLSEYMPLLLKQIELAERLSKDMPAPDFNVTMADGSMVRLSELRGKVVHITFWASWCRQCVGEMRVMERKVKDMLAGKPVEFVYVSLDDDTAAAGQLLQQLNLTGNFTYTTGNWYSEPAQLYGVQSLPAYFLVDRTGHFAVTHPPSPQQSIELMVAISRLY